MEELNTSRGNSLFNNIKNISNKTMQNARDSTEKVFYELKTLEKTGDSSNIFSIIRYILIFLVLFIIIINILHAIRLLPDIFKPIIYLFGHTIETTTEQTSKTTLDGAKTTLDGAKTTLDGAKSINNSELTSLNPELEKIKKDVDKKQINNNIPQPQDSIDSVNKSRGTYKDKLGYCYVGTDQGYRSCIDVENKDECLSGDIFPTKEICINPNLRQ